MLAGRRRRLRLTVRRWALPSTRAPSSSPDRPGARWRAPPETGTRRAGIRRLRPMLAGRLRLTVRLRALPNWCAPSGWRYRLVGWWRTPPGTGTRRAWIRHLRPMLAGHRRRPRLAVWRQALPNWRAPAGAHRWSGARRRVGSGAGFRRARFRRQKPMLAGLRRQLRLTARGRALPSRYVLAGSRCGPCAGRRRLPERAARRARPRCQQPMQPARAPDRAKQVASAAPACVRRWRPRLPRSMPVRRGPPAAPVPCQRPGPLRQACRQRAGSPCAHARPSLEPLRPAWHGLRAVHRRSDGRLQLLLRDLPPRQLRARSGSGVIPPTPQLPSEKDSSRAQLVSSRALACWLARCADSSVSR